MGSTLSGHLDVFNPQANNITRSEDSQGLFNTIGVFVAVMIIVLVYLICQCCYKAEVAAGGDTTAEADSSRTHSSAWSRSLAPDPVVQPTTTLIPQQQQELLACVSQPRIVYHESNLSAQCCWRCEDVSVIYDVPRNPVSTGGITTPTSIPSLQLDTRMAHGQAASNDDSRQTNWSIYRSEAESLKTFCNWPVSFMDKEWGSDGVKCVFCRATISASEKNVPMIPVDYLEWMYPQLES